MEIPAVVVHFLAILCHFAINILKNVKMVTLKGTGKEASRAQAEYPWYKKSSAFFSPYRTTSGVLLTFAGIVWSDQGPRKCGSIRFKVLPTYAAATQVKSESESYSGKCEVKMMAHP
jgi:hypothetical protein